MRNPIVCTDICTAVAESELIVSCSVDLTSQELYACSSSGKVFIWDIWEENKQKSPALNMNAALEGEYSACNDWFNVTVLSDVNMIVAISHTGYIVSMNKSDQILTCEGAVEGGIESAAWSPDRRFLLLKTNNNTVMCMTHNWDVVNEVNIPLQNNLIGNTLSWRGDSEYFAMFCQDTEDSTNKVRIYSKDAEMTAVSRLVVATNLKNPSSTTRAERDKSLMQGLNYPVVAFSAAGGLIAVPRYHRETLQIAFLESNGLHHGDFDIKLPEISGKSCSAAQFEVIGLEWHPFQIVLAVTLRHSSSGMNCVQIYSRNNYHWYLKQQWVEKSLLFLGFDNDNSQRLYLSHRSGSLERSVFRVIDLIWSINSSTDTVDGTVGVVDGNELLLSPLGLAVIPPPMSRYQVKSGWPNGEQRCYGPTRHMYFASAGIQSVQWCCVRLFCDQSFSLFMGSKSAAPISTGGVFNIKDFECFARSGVSADSIDCRLVVANVANENEVRVAFIGSLLFTDMRESSVDFIIGCVFNIASSTITSSGISLAWDFRIDSVIGSYKPGDDAMYVSMHELCASEALVVRVNISSVCYCGGEALFECLNGECYGGDVGGDDECTLPSIKSRFPEICYQLSVIPDVSSQKNVLLLGLSARDRLYCGEMVVCPVVTSYCVNNSLNMILFTTSGAQPELHFLSFEAVSVLIDPLRPEENYVVKSCPRPLERGARLVASIAHSTVVIIQLPRGNLEAFDPRPLTLIRAMQMMDNNDYIKCLQLLRKQRVDSNILYDYNPQKFIENLLKFICDMINTNPDLLNLFVSSLDESTDAMDKYPLPTGFEKLIPQEVGPASASSKVNLICEAIRSNLLPIVKSLMKAQSSGKEKTWPPNDFITVNQDLPLTSVLNPLLLTYAKHNPPMLSESLQLVRELCDIRPIYRRGIVAPIGETLADVVVQSPESRAYSGSISSPTVFSCIKYLTFIVQFQSLFNAAVSEGDFEFARAIARQGQMDPKVYLPLLQEFENIWSDKKSPVTDVTYSYMRFRISIHLGKNIECIEWGVQSIEEIASAELLFSKNPSDQETPITINVSDIGKMVLAMLLKLKSSSLYAGCIERIVAVQKSLRQLIRNRRMNSAMQLNKSIVIPERRCVVDIEPLINDLVRDLRRQYGEFCEQLGNLDEAIVSYLNCEPVLAEPALLAARKGKQWEKALAIASRFASVLDSDYSVKRVAQEIVGEVKFNLEQASADAVSYLFVAGSTAYSTLEAFTAAMIEETKLQEEEFNNGVKIADICLGYCQDVESAVSILLMTKNYRESAYVALRNNRMDLLHDEVSSMVRSVAKDVLTELKTGCTQYCKLVGEVNILWSDTAARLELVSNNDGLLNDMLHGKEVADISDSVSEYSAVSNISRASNLSIISGTSASVSSVLSNLSLKSNDRERESKSKAKSTTFSITGIQHSVLSRGSLKQMEQETSKQKKKREKKESKHGSRDASGLRREGELCTEISAFADVATVANTICNLCDCLLLLNSSTDILLIKQLIDGMNEFVTILQKNIPLSAPNYPADWLAKKSLLLVTLFQEKPLLNTVSVDGNQPIACDGNTRKVDNFWDRAVKGVKLWVNLSSKYKTAC